MKMRLLICAVVGLCFAVCCAGDEPAPALDLSKVPGLEVVSVEKAPPMGHEARIAELAALQEKDMIAVQRIQSQIGQLQQAVQQKQTEMLMRQGAIQELQRLDAEAKKEAEAQKK